MGDLLGGSLSVPPVMIRNKFSMYQDFNCTGENKFVLLEESQEQVVVGIHPLRFGPVSQTNNLRHKSETER